MALTKRQKEVLDYLVAFETKHGYAPSFEEIGKGLKLTSLATVHKHITTLEKKGFIRRGYNQSRSIEVTQLPKPVREQVIARQTMEQTQVANPGEIVVALVRDSEATLKRFYREAGGKIRLQPANSELQPLVVPGQDVKIQGRVISVLRKY